MGVFFIHMTAEIALGVSFPHDASYSRASSLSIGGTGAVFDDGSFPSAAAFGF